MKVVEERDGFLAIRTNGTPVDCIKLSMNILLDERPDLIVSGINHGSNSGVSVIYSGTMGAVFEGAVLHIPSIGFSLCNHKADVDFSHCRELILDVCQKALTHNHWPKNIGLNINIPDVPQLKGSKICRAAQGHWTEEYDCPLHNRQLRPQYPPRTIVGSRNIKRLSNTTIQIKKRRKNISRLFYEYKLNTHAIMV